MGLSVRVSGQVGHRVHPSPRTCAAPLVAMGELIAEKPSEIEPYSLMFGLMPTTVTHDASTPFRRVMEADRSGMAMRSFQTLQQASRMAS